MDADDDAIDLPLYPAWREAERKLLERGLSYGTLVTDAELTEMFGIAPPKSIADWPRYNLEWLKQMDSLRSSLLENHNMMLGRTLGLGYTVIPPAQQTEYSGRRRGRELRHTLRKWAREVTHIALDQLTDEQRKANADAQSRLGTLSTLMSKQIRRLE